jgi:hypothetical protein
VTCALIFLSIFLSHAEMSAVAAQSNPNGKTHLSTASSRKTASGKSTSPRQQQGSKPSPLKGKRSKRRRGAVHPRGQLKPDPERAREIQEKLIESDAMSGTANGVWDSKRMEDAIRKFQQKNGLAATGKLNVKTLKAMGLKSGGF